MLSAAQIRAGRAMVHAKQSELAKAAGISLATLNNIERATGDPRSSTLESIEKALETSGVTFENDGVNEIVTLHSIARPSAYDTFSASQQILEALKPASLLKIENILFFGKQGIHAVSGDTQMRICLAIKGRARTILFDQVDFCTDNAARVAEIAGILLAAYVLHPGKLSFVKRIIADTTINDASEVLRYLKSEPQEAMVHPRMFIDLFDDWDGRISLFANHKGHPMRDLVDRLSRQG